MRTSRSESAILDFPLLVIFRSISVCLIELTDIKIWEGEVAVGLFLQLTTHREAELCLDGWGLIVYPPHKTNGYKRKIACSTIIG